jgi:hypothetical protein
MVSKNGGKPPSGHTKIDYYKHLLDQMWLGEQKVPKEKTEEDGEEECGENATKKGGDLLLDGERPEDYMFTGFVAFALFGPYIPEGLELNWLLHLFNQSDNVKGDITNNPTSRKRGLGRKIQCRKPRIGTTRLNNQIEQPD